MLPPIVADINIASPVVQWLRVHDVDVVYALYERWFRMTDREMLLRASADSRFILTHDADFGKLAIQMGEPYYGIIHLRPGDRLPPEVIADLADLNSRNIRWERGMLAVFRNGRLRIRRPGMN